MRMQESIFVLGPVAARSWGTAPFALKAPDPETVPRELILVAVSPKLKTQLLDSGRRSANWRSLFGYEDRYLFPDLEGYARSHSASTPLRQDFFYDPRYEGKPIGPSINIE
jgi:hypothetical protein